MQRGYVNVHFTDQNIMQKEGGCHELNFHGLKMQKSNIPMDKAQRVHGKISIICLVMLIPRVMVIKMSKIAHSLYFLLITVLFLLTQ